VSRSPVTAVLVVIIAAAGHGGAAYGQGWSADVSAGRLVYDPVSSNVETNNVIAGFRYDSRRETWVYGAGAVPAGEGGTFWVAGGTGGRLIVLSPGAGRATFGADVGAHGFTFHDRVVDQNGAGGTLEAIPFARLSVGEGFVEGRGGWRGHMLSFGGVRENRRVFETGARAGYGGALRVQGDARWVHAIEGTYPFVGATVLYAASRVDVWGQTGKWLATDLGEHVWAVGSGVSLGVRTSVWGSVRQEAPDPLYWNSTRRTWTIGLTQRLGRIAAPLVPVPRSAAGVVIVRLSVADVPAGAVSIAGDFNNWQPAPMQREGEEWVVRLSITPGVYNYAFRTADGNWFVPSSTPGRRDDGMGGYVAVLVVS
jgi:Glycogen recognition site of AMP-activated protein kinase